MRIERADGLILSVPLDQNLRINEGNDGSLSIYFPDSGEMQTYDAEGNVSTQIFRDASGMGTDGDDIYFNFNGSQVDLGEGDDTLFNFADNVTIKGDSGNNTYVLLGDKRNITLNTGDGNNTIEYGQMTNFDIHLGNGDNTIKGGYSENINVTTGSGNTDISSIGVTLSGFTIEHGSGTLTMSANVGMSNNITSMNGGTVRLSAESLGGSIISNGDLDINSKNLQAHITSTGGTNRINVQHRADGSNLNLDGDEDSLVFIRTADTGNFIFGENSGTHVLVGEDLYYQHGDIIVDNRTNDKGFSTSNYIKNKSGTAYSPFWDSSDDFFADFPSSCQREDW
jgi:hypothetical protein